MHNPHSLVEALGTQAMNGGGDDIETLMTMVSVSDVTVNKNFLYERIEMDLIVYGTILFLLQAVAKKLANGKLSMAAAGNLSNVPYLDTM